MTGYLCRFEPDILVPSWPGISRFNLVLNIDFLALLCVRYHHHHHPWISTTYSTPSVRLAMLSQASGLSTVEETKPLLTTERDESSSRTTKTAHGSLPSIDASLNRLFAVIITTGAVHLLVTLVDIVMIQYGAGRFHYWDTQLDSTLVYLFWLPVFGMVLALYDHLFLRYNGRPGHLIPNMLVFGAGGISLIHVSVLAMLEKMWHLGYSSTCNQDGSGKDLWGEPCTEVPGHCTWNESDPDLWHRCVEWSRLSDAVTGLYLLIGFVLGLQFLVLMVTLFVQLYGMPSSPSTLPTTTTMLRLPLGFGSLELNMNWGSTNAEGDASKKDE